MLSSIFHFLITIGQIGLSTYCLYLSSIAIPKLQKYEDVSKTAAKYSNIADNQLYKTRTTQASSVIAVLTTLLSSLSSLLYTLTPIPKLLLAFTNIALLIWVRDYMGEFWKDKKKMPVPGTGDYNDAIGLTQEVRLNMAYLGVSWAVVGGLAFLGF